jgi:hypothetical protein
VNFVLSGVGLLFGLQSFFFPSLVPLLGVFPLYIYIYIFVILEKEPGHHDARKP